MTTQSDQSARDPNVAAIDPSYLETSYRSFHDDRDPVDAQERVEAWRAVLLGNLL
jgi:hypothetical protein